MRIETPEGFSRMDSTDRLLDQIENRIEFLTAELEALNDQLKREKWFFKRRQLEERKQKLEQELRWARFQEQHLTKAVFDKEVRDT